MKKHFENKVFADELEVWNYLQNLKSVDLEVANGHYCIEFTESPVDHCLRLRGVLQFIERPTLNEVLYYRPRYNPRCYVYVRNGHAFCLGVDAAYFVGHDEIEAHGQWELAFYEDRVIDMPTKKPQLTAQECAAACDALVELLIVNAKKVC